MQREISRQTGENFHGNFQLLKQPYGGDALHCTQCYQWFIGRNVENKSIDSKQINTFL